MPDLPTLTDYPDLGKILVPGLGVLVLLTAFFSFPFPTPLIIDNIQLFTLSLIISYAIGLVLQGFTSVFFGESDIIKNKYIKFLLKSKLKEIDDIKFFKSIYKFYNVKEEMRNLLRKLFENTVLKDKEISLEKNGETDSGTLESLIFMTFKRQASPEYLKIYRSSIGLGEIYRNLACVFFLFLVFWIIYIVLYFTSVYENLGLNFYLFNLIFIEDICIRKISFLILSPLVSITAFIILINITVIQILETRYLAIDYVYSWLLDK